MTKSSDDASQVEPTQPIADERFGSWVEISFDCLPLRAVAPVDIPEDASPKLSKKLERLKSAVAQHGTLNTYYLHNAACVYHLTNDPAEGMLEYHFEGVILTDADDMHARRCDLHVTLARETCGWLNQAIANWLGESVQKAVLIEFDRYIQAGDLSRTIERVTQLQKDTEASGGFVGMYL